MFIIIIIILLLIIVGLVFVYFRSKTDKDPKSDIETQCTKEGLVQYVENFFLDHPNDVIIHKEDFEIIVNAADGDENLALLQIANYSSIFATHVVMSEYKVGACVLCSSGDVYIGANFEFTGSLIETVHAEQCAIHNAAVNNETRVVKLAVNAPPCGSCRQFLTEIGNPKDLTIIFCEDGKMSAKTLEQLLPSNFGPANLGMTDNLFNHDPWIVSTSETFTADQKHAKRMLTQSYAPYTNNPVGVSLIFSPDGDIVNGQTIENAAYNPSMSAVRSALSLASLKGKNLKNMSSIVIVKTKEDNTSPDELSDIIKGFDLPPFFSVTEKIVSIIR